MSEKSIEFVKKQPFVQNANIKPANNENNQQKSPTTIFDQTINFPKDGKFPSVFTWKNFPKVTIIKPKNDKPTLRPPLIDKETRNTLDKDLIKGLHENLSKLDQSSKNTTAITQAIHRIHNLNYLKVFKSIEYGPKGQELPEMIVNSKHLNSEQKIQCLKHLTKVGKNHADGNNQRSDDVIPNMEKIFKNSEKTKTLTKQDESRLLADFRKITDRKDTLVTQQPLPPNGTFDGNFKQGNTGDCWLLAGIQSIAQNPSGKKLIDESVNVDKNGNATVTFKSIGRTYKVTARDLKCSNNFSRGDTDIRALEIAMDRYFRESVPEGKADLKGNTVTKAFELLTDKKNLKTYKGNKIPKAIDSLKDNMSEKAVSTAIGGPYDTSWMNATVDGEKVKIYTGHAYSVSKVDDNNVYLINPHDTSHEIKVPIAEYKQIFNLLGTVDLK